MKKLIRSAYAAALAVAACGLLIVVCSVSLADDAQSVVVVPEGPREWLPAAPALLPAENANAQPIEPPALEGPIVGEQVAYEELAAPVAIEEIKAIPVARIDYDVTRKARKRYAGSPFVDLVMVTQNPADKCFYEIPLCLPACCTGEPTVESKCGLMGRGVVKYGYACGLEVEVKFRLRGDVEVEYGT